MKTKSEEWLILGITPGGRSFRPSDWTERLCGTLASYNNKGRWVYSDYAQPILHQGQAGIRVKTALQTINPGIYTFIMDFAYDNRLKIIPAGKVMYLDESAVVTEVSLSVRKLTLALLMHQWKIRFPLKYFGF